MTKKEKSLLLSADMFSSLEQEAKNRVAALCEEIKVQKGEEIALGERLGCLVRGKAGVSVKNSRDAVMKKLTVGEIFGCAALFGGDEVTKIVAESDCKLLCISAENMTDIFLSHPEVALFYIKYLSQKIRFLNSRIGDFAPAPSEQRVLGFLKKAAQKQNPVSISMTLLAKEIGIGRTSLYRALDALENNNLIKRCKNQITVL